MKETAVIVGLVVLVAIAGIIDLCRPKIWIESSRTTAIVHLETLGEYPTTIRHIKIEELPSARVVYEVSRASGTPQLHNFSIATGENLVNVVEPEYGTYQILEPREKSFFLRSGQEYRITVSGDGWIPSHANLEFTPGG